MSEITVPTSDLVRLLDAVAYPNPDDVGPLGPAGPVIRWWDWVALNPQPLPPKWQWTEPWRKWGPHPEPWRSWGDRPDPRGWTMVAQATIGQAMESFEMAGIIVVGGDTERARESIQDSLTKFVDDICGTPPRKGPFPGPWGPVLDPERLHPSNLVIAGAQFHKAAESLGDHPLRGTMQDAAQRLFETGLSRLGER